MRSGGRDDRITAVPLAGHDGALIIYRRPEQGDRPRASAAPMAVSRAHLTDALVRNLKMTPPGPPYRVADADRPGLFVVIGRRTKTFAAQADRRANGGAPVRSNASSDMRQTCQCVPPEPRRESF